MPVFFLREIPPQLMLDMNQEAARRRTAERQSAVPKHTSGALSGGVSLGVEQTAAKPTEPSAGMTDYQMNDTIEHKKWGRGVIVGISGSGEELSIRVIFPDIGMKELFVKYAPIKKVEA